MTARVLYKHFHEEALLQGAHTTRILGVSLRNIRRKKINTI